MDEIILHPSKGSGVQAGPSPESKLEFRGWKRASFSAGLRDLKERMFLCSLLRRHREKGLKL